MPRLLARAVRLIKFGAVAGAAVGVGRLILRRRRLAETGESSWPTIAETAAENGQPVDDAGTDRDNDGAGDSDTDSDGADGADDEA